MVELTVSFKSEESTFKQKFLLYETFSLKDDDPVVKKCIHEALQNAKIEPDSIKVRALLVVE